MPDIHVRLPTLHPGQVRAFMATTPSAYQLRQDAGFAGISAPRYKAIRCGRRWGKSAWLQAWIGDGALKGLPCGFFAPDYKRMLEIWHELHTMLSPALMSRGGANKTDGVLRLITGGRIDFWTLEDENAGRSRKYGRVALDEVAFSKANMMDVWKKSIEPTLLDLRGSCVAASNTNGVDPDNFLWQICHQSEHRFIEVHEPSWNNPLVPAAMPGWTQEQNAADRQRYYDDLKARTPPLVYAQEYEAQFVDWSGAAFFPLDKWLDGDGQPLDWPHHCDTVFAVMDSAIKTGSENDGTAVVYFARNQFAGTPLLILDWDIIQIASDLLAHWVPATVLPRLDELGRLCGARLGVRGVWVEDRASGMTLLQHGQRRGWPLLPIDAAFTAQGKDERAIAVSTHHFQGMIKITRHAHDKTSLYKGTTRNHLEGQVAGFRIGDKDAARRADDLLDAYVYGAALALGDRKGF